MRKSVLIAAIMIILATAFLYPYINLNNLFPVKSNFEIPLQQNTTGGETTTTSHLGEVSIVAPAVDNEGNGVTAIFSVQAIPGEGRVLANINQILFWVDTQYSIQTAKAVAEDVTKVDTSKIDLIYDINTGASVIEGPSAGAALTVATVAVLENKTLNPGVAITGTINPDGSIGPVGGVLAKAEVSKDTGTKIFLVPEGQGVQTNYTPVTTCQQIAGFNYCTTEYKKRQINVTELSGINVIEVGDIQQALKYFLT